MPDLLNPAALARLREPRLARALRYAADESLDVGGGCGGFSGIGSWSNQAVGLGFGGEVSADDVAAIIDFHGSRGVEPKVEVAPHADPSCLARLREAGFTVAGFEQVLVRPLEGALPPIDPSIEVAVLDPTDADQVRRVQDLQARSFASDESAEADDHHRRLFGLYMSHPATRTVIALVDGVEAGSAMVELDPPVAQFFAGGTLPSMRRRGVQRALLVARLRMAIEAGCSYASTDSAPGGGTERNAVRLGFVGAYTRVSLVHPGEGLAPSP